MMNQELKGKLLTALGYYRLSRHHLVHVEESFRIFRPAYHNEEHCFSTALTFHDLAQAAGLSWADGRHGFLAALYHDAHHIMAGDDWQNVTAAVNWLHASPLLEEGVDGQRVVELIEQTMNTNEAFTERVALLLHEADLLQTVKGTVEENRLWQEKLAEEFAKPITEEDSLAFVRTKLQDPIARALFEKATKSGS